jgi:hypothetical protein
MSWLFESPIWIVMIGVAAIAILGGGWVKTGRRVFIVLLAIAITLTVALVALERVVKTDREQVRDKLFQMARDVENNNVNAVLGHLHSQVSPGTVAKIKSDLPPQKFRRVDIKHNLKIDVFSDRSPPRAEARFNVEIAGDFNYQGDHHPNGRVLLTVTLGFYEEEDGRWQVADYEWSFAENPFSRH